MVMYCAWLCIVYGYVLYMVMYFVWLCIVHGYVLCMVMYFNCTYSVVIIEFQFFGILYLCRLELSGFYCIL
jgi:hypothetical protein